MNVSRSSLLGCCDGFLPVRACRVARSSETVGSLSLYYHFSLAVSESLPFTCWNLSLSPALSLPVVLFHAWEFQEVTNKIPWACFSYPKVPSKDFTGYLTTSSNIPDCWKCKCLFTAKDVGSTWMSPLAIIGSILA